MQTLEKRYWTSEGFVVDIHVGRNRVRASTVDPLTLKEFVVNGELNASRKELESALFEKMESILGRRHKTNSQQ